MNFFTVGFLKPRGELLHIFESAIGIGNLNYFR